MTYEARNMEGTIPTLPARQLCLLDGQNTRDFGAARSRLATAPLANVCRAPHVWVNAQQNGART